MFAWLWIQQSVTLFGEKIMFIFVLFLIYFMRSYVSFFIYFISLFITPLKTLKTSGFLMFAEGVKSDQ